MRPPISVPRSTDFTFGQWVVEFPHQTEHPVPVRDGESVVELRQVFVQVEDDVFLATKHRGESDPYSAEKEAMYASPERAIHSVLSGHSQSKRHCDRHENCTRSNLRTHQVSQQ